MKETLHDSDLELQSCPSNASWIATATRLESYANKSVHKKRFPVSESVHSCADLELLRCYPRDGCLKHWHVLPEPYHMQVRNVLHTP